MAKNAYMLKKLSKSAVASENDRHCCVCVCVVVYYGLLH